MKIKPHADTPSSTLNPKGRLARDLQATALQAGYLSIVCAHWLSYQGTPWDAANHEPADMPAAVTGADRFNKARKLCGAWDRAKYGHKTPTYRWKNGWKRSGRLLDNLDSIPTPNWNAAATWDWWDVFHYWLDGNLERDLEVTLSYLPVENRNRVRKELNDY